MSGTAGLGTRLVEFGFILIVPLVVVVAVVAGLFAVGALFEMLDQPEQLRSRIEGIFRRPAKPPRETGPHHYYRPHWRSP